MDNNPEKLTHKRHRFQAVISGFGRMTSYKGIVLETLTLKDVRLAGQEAIVLPSIGLTKGKLWQKCRVGDEVEFNARLAIKVQKAEGSNDYRLDRPTSLTRTREPDNAIKGLLFTNTTEAMRLSHRLNGEGFHFGLLLPYATHTVASLSLLEALEEDELILLRCCALLVVMAEGMEDERSYPLLIEGFEHLLKGFSVLGVLALFDRQDEGDDEELTENPERMNNWLRDLKSDTLFENLPSYSAFFEYAFKQLIELRAVLGRVYPTQVIAVEADQLAEHVDWVREQWGEFRPFPRKRLRAASETKG